MGWFSKSEQDKWDETINDAKENTRRYEKDARKYAALGMNKQAERALDNARETQHIAAKMSGCKHNPRHGGKGFSR